MKGFGAKLKSALLRFMAGRYGTDQLNSVILWSGVILLLVSMFLDGWLSFVLWLLAYVCMGLALYRTFSRQTYKRYQENRRFQSFLERLKDRDHRYFACPKCKQSVRVPKGKGKIAITCPKCREKFIKKT
jgi:ribosomal protein L37AE/L43A